LDGEEGVVDGAQLVAGNDEDAASEGGDEVEGGEALAKRGEETASAFDEELGRGKCRGELPVRGMREIIKDVVEVDGPAVDAGGDEGSDRLGEVERVDFVKGQDSVLQGVEERCIGATAGAKGFEGQRVAILFPQVAEEQRGQEGFADTGVGAGDEEDASAIGPVHGTSKAKGRQAATGFVLPGGRGTA
jgi:hypothetical protein